MAGALETGGDAPREEIKEGGEGEAILSRRGVVASI
jgi:hypothetical protein